VAVEETRGRILEAAMAVHEELGPLHATGAYPLAGMRAKP
jgi:hypothetical protein